MEHMHASDVSQPTADAIDLDAGFERYEKYMKQFNASSAHPCIVLSKDEYRAQIRKLEGDRQKVADAFFAAGYHGEIASLLEETVEGL